MKSSEIKQIVSATVEALQQTNNTNNTMKNSASTPAKTTIEEAAKAAVAAPKGTFSLNMLNYAKIETAERTAKALASVRQGGQVVFNAAANKIVGFPEKTYFMIGNNPNAEDPAEKLYLVPAKSDTPNAIKATKNNDGFQFRQDNVITGLGAALKDRFEVTEEKDGDVVYYVLTKLTKEEADAADTAEKAEEGK